MSQIIEECVAKSLENTDCFLVDLKIGGNRIQKKITVLIDTDQGVGIDQCTEVSRNLGKYLEETEAMEQAYTLEVSSPGVDVPLKFQRQYHRHIGRNLEVLLQNGEKKVTKLMEVHPDFLVVIEEKKRKKNEVALPKNLQFEDIKQAVVQISFK